VAQGRLVRFLRCSPPSGPLCPFPGRPLGFGLPLPDCLAVGFPVNLGNEAKTKLSMYGRVSGEGKERDEIKWDQLDKIHIQCVDGMHENR
jgi:hypothetical protein